MIIAFITDLHLPSLGEKARGVDTYHHFHMVLDDLRGFPINHIIIGGDLSFKAPESAVNEYVKFHLQQLEIPYDILPGNHDSIEQLRSSFKYPAGLQKELYYVKQIQGEKIIFLDSSQKKLGQDQLSFLESELISNPEIRHIMVHHPIIKAHVPYMDNHHALEDMEEIQEVLHKFNHLFHIFSGHYHVEKTICHKNIIQHITPSLFIQINQESEEFKIEHKVPGYRVIEMVGESLYTGIKYKIG
jgi:Icc protein